MPLTGFPISKQPLAVGIAAHLAKAANALHFGMRQARKRLIVARAGGRRNVIR